MIDLPKETFRRDAALAGTYNERNKPQEHQSQNWKRRSVLGRRKIIHHKILLGLFQERLNASFQLLYAKSRIVLGIGIPWSW